VGRAFVYRPEASRDAMRHAAIRELLEGFFDGSEAELTLFLREADRQAAPATARVEEHQRIDTVLL
jgi:predicted transcriptional regulator